MKNHFKTFYGLRLRASDSEPWGEPEFFSNRKERDKASAFNRLIGGLRTWSFDDKQEVEPKSPVVG